MQLSITFITLIAAVSAAPGYVKSPCHGSSSTTTTLAAAPAYAAEYDAGSRYTPPANYQVTEPQTNYPVPEPTPEPEPPVPEPSVEPPKTEEAFALKIKSFWHRKLNGQYITGLHIGAAIDLVVPSGHYEDKSFYLNTVEGSEIGQLDYRVSPNIPFKAALMSDTSSAMSAFTLSVLPQLSNAGFTKKGQLMLGGKSEFYVCEIPTRYGVKTGLAWRSGKKNDRNVMKNCKGVKLYKA